MLIRSIELLLVVHVAILIVSCFLGCLIFNSLYLYSYLVIFWGIVTPCIFFIVSIANSDYCELFIILVIKMSGFYQLLRTWNIFKVSVICIICVIVSIDQLNDVFKNWLIAYSLKTNFYNFTYYLIIILWLKYFRVSTCKITINFKRDKTNIYYIQTVFKILIHATLLIFNFLKKLTFLKTLVWYPVSTRTSYLQYYKKFKRTLMPF